MRSFFLQIITTNSNPLLLDCPGPASSLGIKLTINTWARVKFYLVCTSDQINYKNNMEIIFVYMEIIPYYFYNLVWGAE